MANYMYLFRGGKSAGSPSEMQAEMQKWNAWMQQLQKSGNFKSGEPLDTGGKVLRGSKRVVTDGPYAEAKDLVGGFLLVTADSLDQAAELARGCPIFESDGSVEVRAVRQM